MILPITAKNNRGICYPCKDGRREQVDRRKLFQASLIEENPIRDHWFWLVDIMQSSEAESVSRKNKIYFSTQILVTEWFNLGFKFYLRSGGCQFIHYARDGLIIAESRDCRLLLDQAYELLSDSQYSCWPVSEQSWREWREKFPTSPDRFVSDGEKFLNNIGSQNFFWHIDDAVIPKLKTVAERMISYGKRSGLYRDFT